MAVGIENSGPRVAAMAKRAGERVAPAGRAVGQIVWIRGDRGGFERRTVMAAAPNVNGRVRPRCGERGRMKPSGNARIDVGADEREVATGNQPDDPRRNRVAFRQPDRQVAVNGHVFRRQHLDRRLGNSDDRTGSDPVIALAACEDHDGTVLAAVVTGLAGKHGRERGEKSQSTGQSAGSGDRGGRVEAHCS
jgi:hypothetical protein